jgi:WD40 repeat protein
VTGCIDIVVEIWDIKAGVEIETLTEHLVSVWGVAWSVDGAIVTVSELGDIRLHRKRPRSS